MNVTTANSEGRLYCEASGYNPAKWQLWIAHTGGPRNLWFIRSAKLPQILKPMNNEGALYGSFSWFLCPIASKTWISNGNTANSEVSDFLGLQISQTADKKISNYEGNLCSKSMRKTSRYALYIIRFIKVEQIWETFIWESGHFKFCNLNWCIIVRVLKLIKLLFNKNLIPMKIFQRFFFYKKR